jgi:muconolactone delta-isomerase
MQFLTMSRRRVDAFGTEAFTPELLAAESQRVRELNAAGTLQQIWLRGDVPGAAIVWEAASEEDLRATIATLPIFKAGMLEIVALAPLKPYPGLAPKPE